MLLRIVLESTAALASLEPRAAPATCGALAGILPFSTTAHYAKIAGQEIYAHLPLILEFEGRRSISNLTTGAVAFWPERQLFVVYYGRIQEEDAEVTLLGHVIENLDGLCAAGEELRRVQGRRFVSLRLEPVEPSPKPSQRPIPLPASSPRARSTARLMAAYDGMTRDVPPDIDALLARQGVMRPAGALIYAEAESRKLHEVLWLVRRHLHEVQVPPEFVAILLRHFALRLGGWCGLKEAAALVREVADELRGLSNDSRVDAVEALMLYMGRLNMWLDAFIPWDELNTLLQPAHGRPGPPVGGSVDGD